MTTKSKAQLQSDIDSILTTNGANSITAAQVNTLIGDVVDSLGTEWVGLSTLIGVSSGTAAFANFTGSTISATSISGILQELESAIDNFGTSNAQEWAGLDSLIGVSSGTSALGNFTGGTITSNSISGALAQLEAGLNNVGGSSVNTEWTNLDTLVGVASGTSAFGNFTGSVISATTISGALQDLEAEFNNVSYTDTNTDTVWADLDTLVGVSSGTSAFGNFTGSVISATTISGALQDLEAEFNNVSYTDTNTDTVWSGLDTLVGVASGTSTLGNFAGNVITSSNSISGAIQELETHFDTIGGLTVASVSGTGSQTGSVGVFTMWNASGISTHRDFTLPSSATVGESCGIRIGPVSSTYRARIKTASAGQTIGGLDCSTIHYRHTNAFTSGMFFVFKCVSESPLAWEVVARWQGTGHADDPPDGFRPVVADDSTDNTDAINALAAAKMKEIILPRGDIRCDGVLYLQGTNALSGGVLRGQGKVEDEDVMHTGTVLKFTGQQLYGIWLGGQAYAIYDLTLQGAATDTFSSGSQASWAINVGHLGQTGLETGKHIFKNVYIRNFASGGVFINDYQDLALPGGGATACDIAGTNCTLVDTNAYSGGLVSATTGLCTFDTGPIPADAENMYIQMTGGDWIAIDTRLGDTQCIIDNTGIANSNVSFLMQRVWPNISANRASGNPFTTPYLLVDSDLPFSDPANPPRTVTGGYLTNVLTVSDAPGNATNSGFQFWYFREAQSAHQNLTHVGFRDTPTAIKLDNAQAYAHTFTDVSVGGSGGNTDIFIDCQGGGDILINGSFITETNLTYLKLGPGVGGSIGNFRVNGLWTDSQAAQSGSVLQLVNDLATVQTNISFVGVQISVAGTSPFNVRIDSVRSGSNNPMHLTFYDSAFNGAMNTDGNITLDGGTLANGEAFVGFFNCGVSANHIGIDGDNYVVVVEEKGNRWYRVNSATSVVTFTLNDPTPEVGGTESAGSWRRPFHVFAMHASSTTAITDFDYVYNGGGALDPEGMEIMVRGNGSCDINDSATIRTKSGAAITPTSTEYVTFRSIGGVWYEK